MKQKVVVKPTAYWPKVLARAEERIVEGKRPFTSKQVEKAAGWQTCVCGKQDPRIPREVFDGQPEDVQLADAGYAFYDAVASTVDNPNKSKPSQLARVRRARKLMHKIEKRAVRVLREVTAKEAAYSCPS